MGCGKPDAPHAALTLAQLLLGHAQPGRQVLGLQRLCREQQMALLPHSPPVGRVPEGILPRAGRADALEQAGSAQNGGAVGLSEQGAGFLGTRGAGGQRAGR